MQRWIAIVLGLVVAAPLAACSRGTAGPVTIREPDLPGAIDVDALRRELDRLGSGEGLPLADGRAYGAYLKAQQALRDGDVGAAIRYLRITVRRDPSATMPRLRLAQLLTMVGESEEAAPLLGGTDLDPAQLPPELLEIYILHAGKTGDDEAAEAALRLGVERGTLNPVVLLQWFSAAEYRQPPEQLRDFVEDLQDDAPDVAMLDCIAGHLNVRLGDYRDARKPLDRCLDAFPDWLPGMLEQGLVAELDGDFEAARLWYRRVLAQQPGQALATWRLRTLQQAAAGDAAAQRHLSNLLAEVRYETAIQLAAEALRSGDDVRAEAVLRGLTPGQQERPRTRLLLGPIAERRGRFDDAEELYEEALTAPAIEIRRIAAIQWMRLQRTRNPESWQLKAERRYDRAPGPATALALGLALSEDDLAAGIEFMQGAIERYPDDAELRYRLGVFHERAGDRAAALERMEEAIVRDDQHAEALNFLGYSLAEEGRDLERAEALIGRALELRPNAGYIMDSMGWVLFQLGRAEEALPWLEQALELEGADPVILEHLGDAYAVTGAFDEARAAYQEALSLFEDPADAARLQDKLLDLDERNGR